MLATTSSAELAEWEAYWRINPFGPVRGDYQAALVAQTVAAAHGSKAKLKDFLLRFEPRKPQSPELQQHLLNLFFLSLGNASAPQP